MNNTKNYRDPITVGIRGDFKTKHLCTCTHVSSTKEHV
jgi:hypothetical protein